MSLESSVVALERRADADRVLQGLLRPLVAKRQLAAGEVGSILAAAYQRLLTALNAETLLVYRDAPGGLPRLGEVHRSHRHVRGGHRPPQGDLDASAVASSDQAPWDLTVPAIVPGDVTAPEWATGPAREAGLHISTCCLAPVRHDGRVCVVLVAANKLSEELFETPHFQARDLELLVEFVEHAGSVLARGEGSAVELTEEETARCLARLAHLEVFEPPSSWTPSGELLGRAGQDLLARHLILPIEILPSGHLKVGMVNPFDVVARDAFRARVGLEVERTVVVTKRVVLRVLAAAFPGVATEPGRPEDTRRARPPGGAAAGERVEREEGGVATTEDSDGIVRLANRIIEEAHADRASDIHIEPFEKEIKVRYRVDGYLKEVMSFPGEVARALVSRLKIMTRSMDITENRLPQDGRIKFKEFSSTGIDIDLRVSTAPLAFGQKVVLRILDKGTTSLGLEKMGFSPSNLRRYREMIQKPYGMVLHVGPTGSGKTTTLYSALSELNKPDVNIQTAEDPIEYMLPNVNHMQMQKDIGLTFAAALRCFLRQDPDIILVGEIRDLETAEIAIEAALTGHLIFSTMHTNDAPGTVSRFVEMGVQPFLVSSALLIVCAQRLMRRLCPRCKVEYLPSSYECLALGLQAPQPIFRPREGGCTFCKNAGFKGRIGVHELMTIDDRLKAQIARGASGEELKESAVANGMVPLYDDAMEKVLEGITSIDEALSVVRKE